MAILSADAPTRFLVLFAVAPGEQERNRATDLLDALFHYEPHVTRVVIVDDGADLEPVLATLAPRFRDRVVIVKNPRAGRGVGWRDGLTVGLFEAFATILPLADEKFVLKLDTDSLVVAPFAAKIATRFAADPRVGLLGTHSINPDKTPFDSNVFLPLIHWTAQPVYFNLHNKYSPRGLHFNLGPIARRRRAIIQEAKRRGYIAPESCQGGGYAISCALLADARRGGHFTDPLLWLDCPLTEDIVLGITARACGFSLADYNGCNEPFGVKYSGLPGMPAEIVRNGYSIIHSVKNDPRYTEPEIRAFFRARRIDFTARV